MMSGKWRSINSEDDYLVQYFDNYDSGYLTEAAPNHGGEKDIVIIAGRRDAISLSHSLTLPFHSHTDSLSVTESLWGGIRGSYGGNAAASIV